MGLKPKSNKKVPRKIFMYSKTDTDSFSADLLDFQRCFFSGHPDQLSVQENWDMFRTKSTASWTNIFHQRCPNLSRPNRGSPMRLKGRLKRNRDCTTKQLSLKNLKTGKITNRTRKLYKRKSGIITGSIKTKCVMTWKIRATTLFGASYVLRDKKTTPSTPCKMDRESSSMQKARLPHLTTSSSQFLLVRIQIIYQILRTQLFLLWTGS